MPPFLLSGHGIDPALTPVYRRVSGGGNELIFPNGTVLTWGAPLTSIDDASTIALDIPSGDVDDLLILSGLTNSTLTAAGYTTLVNQPSELKVHQRRATNTASDNASFTGGIGAHALYRALRIHNPGGILALMAVDGSGEVTNSPFNTLDFDAMFVPLAGPRIAILSGFLRWINQGATLAPVPSTSASWDFLVGHNALINTDFSYSVFNHVFYYETPMSNQAVAGTLQGVADIGGADQRFRAVPIESGAAIP